MCFTIRVADRFASTDFIVKRLHSEQIKYNIDFNYSIYQYINLQHIKHFLKKAQLVGKRKTVSGVFVSVFFLDVVQIVCVCVEAKE